MSQPPIVRFIGHVGRRSCTTAQDKEPFASLLKGDVKGALAGGGKAIVDIGFMAVFSSEGTRPLLLGGLSVLRPGRKTGAWSSGARRHDKSTESRCRAGIALYFTSTTGGGV